MKADMISEQELVSVVIPVYNIASYIKECIMSIQAQTYSNLEIIIIDDGSTDGSGEICEEIAKSDDRIQVIRQENAGVMTARERAVKLSSGKYLLFVDGDDWIEKTMLEVLISKIQNADMVSSGVFEQLASGYRLERLDEFPEGYYSKEKKESQILKKMIFDKTSEKSQIFTPWIWNKLYISDLAKKVLQEIDTTIRFAEDSVFLYKYLLKCHSIVICHQCFYHYRYRKESAIHSVNNHMLIDINRVYLALADDFRNYKLGLDLLFQLQKWVSRATCLALNYHMGFDEQAGVPEFIADISYLENKRIILYGAGKLGQITHRQLEQFGYSIVLWVDKAYKIYQDKGFDVVSPDEILTKDYDIVLIAVNDKNIVEKIKKELFKMGIPKEVILWKDSIRVF